MVAAILTLVAASSFVGAATQRLTGFGFGMVAAPFLVLALGPVDGVILVNTLGLAINIALLATLHRHIDLGMAVLVTIPGALVGAPVGGWVVRQLPASTLSMALGVLLLVVLVMASVRPAARRHFSGNVAAVSASVTAGFMTATSGVGGPVFAVYAMSREWDHLRYVATMQVCFGWFSLAAILTKGMPSWTSPYLSAALLGLAAGTVAGHFVSAWVSQQKARVAMMGMAYGGATTTILKGALDT